MSHHKATVKTSSRERTTAEAAKIGARLKGGEVIELVSDLGGGKTTFTKGLVKGLGSEDKVSSPSFTLENIYSAGELSLHHLDFYRLDDPGIMRDMLNETVSRADIVVIEWADIVKDVLPSKRLVVELIATGQDDRQINFSYPDELGYLFEA